MRINSPIFLQRLLTCFACITCGTFLSAQHTNKITASLDPTAKTLNVQQEFLYVNDSKDTLNVLYFNDWASSYASKKTALAKRFAEEFKKVLHLAKDSERGKTTVVSMVDDKYTGLLWERTEAVDIIKIKTNRPLLPGASLRIYITYNVKLPPNRYAPYGYDSRDGYYLKDWYLTPVVYDKEWFPYSNVGLEDIYTDVTNTTITFTYPKNLYLTSNFDLEKEFEVSKNAGAVLIGKNRKSAEIILSRQKRFLKHVTPTLTVNSDLEIAKFDVISQGVSINKVSRFITDNLGDYPHPTLLVSELDYNKNPLYGINQLPSFIRPYEEQFQFEMKFLKTALNSFIRETIYVNPRKEQWVTDAIVNYMMIKYVDDNYPDQKLLGKLSKIWGFRKYHLARMSFNDQYAFLNLVSARRNTNQPLSTPNDSLIRFNQKIANKYSAGLGLAYLSSYIGKNKVDKSIKDFYNLYKLQSISSEDFKAVLAESTTQDINWFFSDYISSRRIDFKITNAKKEDDSITITLKNKSGTNVPISLFGLRKDTVVSKYWFTDIADEKTVTIPSNDENRLVLNYDQKIPEFNQRDNWKSLNGFLSSNKKLKFQFFKDTEDPYYNQILYVPVLGFNIHDGLTPGLRFTNNTFLERPFVYDFNPQYSVNEKTLVGFGRISYNNYLNKSGLFFSSFSLGGSSAHFQQNSRFTTVTPRITLGWRPDNLISNKRDFLSLRWVNVFRSIDENLQDLETDPDYSVLNLRFRHSNSNTIINSFSWFADAQYAADFTKLSFSARYRRLFNNNRQVNLRFFAGKFLSNQTGSDFFSFALDRPTDYLFDLSFLVRSEDPSILSQQIIIAEGGFKSELNDAFANDWITTANASINLWRWIEVYGDAGFVRNRGQNPQFVYDSGIRLNLVTDFFELYFPAYSNNGFEPAQQNYGERIRFIITFSPRTLIGLFTRKWF